jgi:hypothetical protein
VAISFIGYANTTYASRTNTTVSNTLNAGTITNDDILILTLFTFGAGTEAPDPSGVPSGFSQVGTTMDVTDIPTNNGEFRVYIKKAASESGSYAFTHSSCSSQGSLSVWRGVDTTTAQDATATTNSGSPANTTRTWTGLTTVTNDAWIVGLGFDWADNANALSPPTGMTERLEVNPLVYIASEAIAAAGATGNRTHTCNANSGWPRGGLLLALRPASAGAYTLDATTSASYAITGTAVSTLLGRRVDAATASYAITGTAAGTYYGRKVAADTASYTISGTAVTFPKTWILDAATGSYAITGTAASGLLGRLVDAAAGSYAVTGSDVTLRRALPLVADAGSYAISGTAAGTLHGWLVSADGGSYTVTGSDVTLTYLAAGRVTADAGSYAISGTDVSLLASHIALAADGGSYEISGTDAAVLAGYLADASGGSYAIDGSPVTLTYSGEVEPEPEPEPEAPPRTHGGGGRWGTSGRRIVWPKKKREEWQEYVRDEIRRLYGTLDVEEAVEAVAPYIPAEVDPRAVQAVVRALVPSAPLAEIKRAVAPLVDELDLIALDEDFLRFVEARWQSL